MYQNERFIVQAHGVAVILLTALFVTGSYFNWF
jgi:hypothetical protein